MSPIVPGTRLQGPLCLTEPWGQQASDCRGPSFLCTHGATASPPQRHDVGRCTHAAFAAAGHVHAEARRLSCPPCASPQAAFSLQRGPYANVPSWPAQCPGGMSSCSLGDRFWFSQISVCLRLQRTHLGKAQGCLQLKTRSLPAKSTLYIPGPVPEGGAVCGDISLATPRGLGRGRLWEVRLAWPVWIGLGRLQHQRLRLGCGAAGTTHVGWMTQDTTPEHEVACRGRSPRGDGDRQMAE